MQISLALESPEGQWPKDASIRARPHPLPITAGGSLRRRGADCYGHLSLLRPARERPRRRMNPDALEGVVRADQRKLRSTFQRLPLVEDDHELGIRRFHWTGGAVRCSAACAPASGPWRPMMRV